METFVEITNSAKVRSNSNLVLSGIQANKSGWNPYSFYPNNGVVGVLIGEAQCYEGTYLYCTVWRKAPSSCLAKWNSPNYPC